MNNTNILVTGMMGAGKSNMAKYLKSITPRAFVLDRKGEYEGGAIFTDFRECYDFFRKNMRKNWHIIFRGDSTESFIAWFDILYNAQHEFSLPPLGLFVEEADFFSTSHDAPQAVRVAYTMGRAALVNIVTVAQRDTQVNVLLRSQAHLWVALRQRVPGSDTKTLLQKAEVESLPDLETYIPGDPPEWGKHFLTDQGEIDVGEYWLRHFDETPPEPAPEMLEEPEPLPQDAAIEPLEAGEIEPLEAGEPEPV